MKKFWVCTWTQRGIIIPTECRTAYVFLTFKFVLQKLQFSWAELCRTYCVRHAASWSEHENAIKQLKHFLVLYTSVSQPLWDRSPVNSFFISWSEHANTIKQLKHFLVLYTSVSQPLWDRSLVNSFFIRWGPGPNRFTHLYLSNFF